MTAVTYALDIDGAPATPELLGALQRVEVEDHAEMADMLRLTLGVAVRDDGSGWTMLDGGPFRRLANVKVSVTVGSGPAVPLISAYVLEAHAVFSNVPGQSVLTVVAMDPTVLMHLEEKVKAWPDMADSDVASAVFGDAAYGFTPVVEATRWKRDHREQTLIQRGTDIQLVGMLAERNGFECFVELNPDTGEVEGHFHPPRLEQSPQGVLSVNLGQATNVNSFSARHDMLGPTTARVTAVDPESGEDQPASAEGSALRELGGAAAGAHDRPRTTLLTRTGMARAGELQAYAQAVVDRSAWAIVAEGELSAAAYGNILRAKRPVMVRGAGQEFSGAYYVERVLHVLTAEGYTQRFTLRRNALGLTGRERFTDDGGLAG